jgi:hypothetical protein
MYILTYRLESFFYLCTLSRSLCRYGLSTSGSWRVTKPAGVSTSTAHSDHPGWEEATDCTATITTAARRPQICCECDC